MLYHLWRYYLRDYRYHVSLRQLVGPMADCLQGRHTYTTLCLLCGTIARQSDIFLTVEEAGQVRPGSPGPRGWGKERGGYKPAELGSALERVYTRENGNDDASHIVGGDAKILKCHKTIRLEKRPQRPCKSRASPSYNWNRIWSLYRSSAGRCHCPKNIRGLAQCLGKTQSLHALGAFLSVISAGGIWEHQQAFWSRSDRLVSVNMC